MASASEKRILVVDDEPDVRNFLVACIEDAGFQVDFAVDGVDALEKIEANPPDLMTLDMVMPRRSGISLMRRLKKHEIYSDIPIIVITAHAHDEFGSEDFKEFNAFATRDRPKITMEKPVTPEKLVASICEILEVTPEKEMVPTSEQDALINLIKASDKETLSKISELLKG